MEQFEGFMEYLLNSLVNTAIHLFELVGVIVLIVAGVCGVVNYIRHDPTVRLKLAQGYGVTHAKPEFEDAAALAREHGVPYQEVVKEIFGKL